MPVVGSSVSVPVVGSVVVGSEVPGSLVPGVVVVLVLLSLPLAEASLASLVLASLVDEASVALLPLPALSPGPPENELSSLLAQARAAAPRRASASRICRAITTSMLLR